MDDLDNSQLVTNQDGLFRPRKQYTAIDFQRASTFIEDKLREYWQQKEEAITQLGQTNAHSHVDRNQNELEECVAKLNDDQRAAYEFVAHKLQQPGGEPLSLILMGGAGTGKSFLIRTIVKVSKFKLFILKYK